jgi:O-antigen ligase
MIASSAAPRRGATHASSVTLPAPPLLTPDSRERAPRDLLRIVVFGIILLSQGRLHEHFGFLGRLRPALLLVAFAAVLAALRPSLLSKARLLSTTPARLMAALGAMSLASAALGISFGASAVMIIDSFWKTLLLGFLVVASIRHAGDLLTYCGAMACSSAFHIYLTTFVFGLSSAYGSATLRLDDMYMFDANEVTCVLLASVGAIGLIAQTSRGAMRLAMVALLLGIGAAVARTGSRGGFLGLVAVGVMLLLVLRGVPASRRLALVGVACIGLIIFAPDGYWEQMRTILEPKNDYNWNSSDGRRQIWKRGMSYLLEYPVAGVGIGNFARAECSMGLKAVQVRAGDAVTCTAAHNSFVQAGAEAGLPGLFLFIGMTLGTAISMWRLGSRLPRHWLKADREAQVLYWAPQYLAVSLIGFSVPAFFVSFSWHDLPFLLAAMCAGTIASIRRRLAAESLRLT